MPVPIVGAPRPRPPRPSAACSPSRALPWHPCPPSRAPRRSSPLDRNPFSLRPCILPSGAIEPLSCRSWGGFLRRYGALPPSALPGALVALPLSSPAVLAGIIAGLVALGAVVAAFLRRYQVEDREERAGAPPEGTPLERRDAVLVFGSTGRLGRLLVGACLEAGRHVVAAGRQDEGALASLLADGEWAKGQGGEVRTSLSPSRRTLLPMGDAAPKLPPPCCLAPSPKPLELPPPCRRRPQGLCTWWGVAM